MVGIGFRKEFSELFLENNRLNPDFIEVAPENWVNIGGYWKKQLMKAIEKYPLYTHGLSLSLGSPDELDFDFLKKVKLFLKETGAKIYTEHLSYAKCDNAHLYDLLPMPFTQEAVKHVAQRIKTVQDFLEQRIAIELVSYYSPIAPEMEEADFINAVLEEADTDLLLDVNNVYVNSFNHKYDAFDFMSKMKMDRVAYIHMAGHEQVAEDLIIDTHGEAIIDPVYDLFENAMSLIGRDVPVLLERDYNIPDLEELQMEMDRMQNIKNQVLNGKLSANFAHSHLANSI